MVSPPGWILVWDLDETLVAGWPKEPCVNEAARSIVRLAAKARQEGRVDRIFVLTNNSDKDYIAKALSHFPRFDGVMDSTHLSRKRIDTTNMNANVTKSLADIVQLYADIDITVTEDSIRDRVLFFDNYPTHTLLHEIPEKHYIHISPDFKCARSSTPDATRWDYVRGLLTASRKRKTLKKRRKTRRFKMSGRLLL